MTPQPTEVPSILDEIQLEEMKQTLYINGNEKDSEFGLILPKNVVVVSSFNGNHNDKIPVMIDYSSDMPIVAKVNPNGKILAKSEGIANVTAIVTLKDGTAKKFIVTVTVQTANIEVTQSMDRMKVGESAVFEVKVNGVKESNIMWKTSTPELVEVSKSKGELVTHVYAKSHGIACIEVSAANIRKLIFITVE